MVEGEGREEEGRGWEGREGGSVGWRVRGGGKVGMVEGVV